MSTTDASTTEVSANPEASAADGSATLAQPEQLGQPIRGPQALSEDWARFWHLTYNIARNEFKLKFFGSALGYFWQLMRPLLMFGVLYAFFVVIGKVGQKGGPGERFYGVQLLGSIVLFTFFSEATVGAVRSVVDRESLVRKIQFPRLVIPLSVTLLAAFNLALNLIVVLGFALISGVRPMLSWLELPLILALLVVLTTGVAMLLSALFVRFRDIQPIWDVFSQVLFYGSPTIITLEAVRDKLDSGKGALGEALYHVYLLNPLATIFQQFRHAMVNKASVSAVSALGGWPYLAVPLAIVATVFLLGFWVFNRSAPMVAENL